MDGSVNGGRSWALEMARGRRGREGREGTGFIEA